MTERSKASKNSKGAGRRRTLVRVLWGLGLGLPVAIAVLWVLVHRVEWMGPLVANSLRAVIGTDNVAKLEDFVYSIEDRVNRTLRSDEKPKAYWVVEKPKETPAPAPKPEQPEVELPPFAPEDVGPMLKSWSAPGDGEWVPISDPRRPDEPHYMMKTLLHPDANRSWSEVFVVAIDLRRVRLHMVPGTREPAATEPEAENIERPGTIPRAHHEELLAAFNGGFMTEHGSYGMHFDGLTLVKPKDKACSIAAYPDDRLRVASWEKLKEDETKFKWWRQVPNCMAEDGKLHFLLGDGARESWSRKWGATLDGDTVIRRSAIGLARGGDVLLVAITNHTTARAVADAMLHAGASTVAQLDVNWSYPKFVLFEPEAEGEPRKAVALAPGFEFSEDEYIRKRNLRDFFYLMRKDREYDLTARN